MADPATDQSDSAPPPPTDYGNVAASVGRLEANLREKKAKTAPIVAKMSRQEQKVEDLSEQEAARPEATIPDAPKPPEPDPIRGFASAAGMFALLAAAFTKTPAIAAMNGMAAAITARNANDQKGYEQAYQQWKENADLALKRDTEHRARVSQALDMMKTNVALGQAMLHAVDTEYGDENGLVMNAASLFDKREELNLSRGRLANEMRRTQQEIDANAPIAFAGASMAAAMKSGDPQKIAAAQELMKVARGSAGNVSVTPFAGPDGKSYLMKKDQQGNVSWTDTAGQSVDPPGSVTRIAGKGNVGQMQLSDVKDDLRKAHPEWSEGQLDQAANQQIAISKRVPGVSMTSFVAGHLAEYEKSFAAKNSRAPTDEELGTQANLLQGKQVLNANQFNTLEDRAQQFSLALDQVQKIRELIPKAVGIATRVGQPLEKIEAVGNMLGMDSSTDRADFESALAFLRVNAPLLLKQANPTSRAIGGDQAMVNRIIRGEQWGDSRLNVEAAMENLNGIFQQDLSIMQQQAQRSGRSLGLPSLAPHPTAGAAAPPATAAPWNTDPVVP